jgi:hypothetical protein
LGELRDLTTILSVKMDRENSLTLLLPDWGSNPIPSDPESEPPTDFATGSGSDPCPSALLVVWTKITALLLILPSVDFGWETNEIATSGRIRG